MGVRGIVVSPLLHRGKHGKHVRLSVSRCQPLGRGYLTQNAHGEVVFEQLLTTLQVGSSPVGEPLANLCNYFEYLSIFG